MKPTLTPYLNFNGNTAEAMRFYQSILGGELTMQTFGEAKMARTPEEKNMILHAALKNDALSLMAHGQRWTTEPASEVRRQYPYEHHRSGQRQTQRNLHQACSRWQG